MPKFVCGPITLRPQKLRGPGSLNRLKPRFLRHWAPYSSRFRCKYRIQTTRRRCGSFTCHFIFTGRRYNEKFRKELAVCSRHVYSMLATCCGHATDESVAKQVTANPCNVVIFELIRELACEQPANSSCSDVSLTKYRQCWYRTSIRP